MNEIKRAPAPELHLEWGFVTSITPKKDYPLYVVGKDMKMVRGECVLVELMFAPGMDRDMPEGYMRLLPDKVFTREDVVMLRDVSDCVEKLNEETSGRVGSCRASRDLADRIEALLPPEET